MDTRVNNRDGASSHQGWFPVCLWLHRWTSLIATPFFLVLCVTGIVLIFHDEADDLLGQRPPAAAAPEHPLSLGRMTDAALAASPGMIAWSVGLDKDQPDRAFVRIVPPGSLDGKDGKTVLVNRATGQPMAAMPGESTFAGFLLKLHEEWFLGMPGRLFGAFIAFLVLVSLATGVIVHAPFVRKMVLGTIRRGRGARILQLDLHNMIGLVVLGWLTVVTLSGILLAADVLLVQLWKATELREMTGNDVRPATLVPLDTVVAAAEAARPDRALRFIFYPGTTFSSAGHFTAGLYGQQRYNERLFDVVLIDAGTGAVSGARAMPWYLQAVLVSVPLHFGDYGGLPLKIVWAASAMGSLFITGNGAWLWWQRRQRKLKRVHSV